MSLLYFLNLRPALAHPSLAYLPSTGLTERDAAVAARHPHMKECWKLARPFSRFIPCQYKQIGGIHSKRNVYIFRETFGKKNDQNENQKRLEITK